MAKQSTASENVSPSCIDLGSCVIDSFVMITLLIFAPVLLFLEWRRSASQEVKEKIAAIRATGQPKIPEKLNAFYASPPDEKDTTDIWLDATRPITTKDFGLAAGTYLLWGHSNFRFHHLANPESSQTKLRC